MNIQHLLPDSNYTCFVIPSLFSKAECEGFLNEDIRNSFQKANSNYPAYYRNNDRFVKDDDRLANYLFEIVNHFLPQTIETKSEIQSENGKWQLKELNSRIRFCKYSANQYFHRHLDGIHYRNDTTQSKLTFMIYLNSATEFKGGKTLFFKTRETTEIWASYTPKQGDIIIFDHNVWHEGEVLTEGEKFVLRSDILYSKTEPAVKKEPFEGHLGYIWSLLKMDNNHILSGGRDKEIKVWTELGKQKHSLKEHQNSIVCLEKMNDNIFISGSRDREIIVWKDYKRINRIKNHSAIVLSLCRLDNSRFASGSGDKTVQITNLSGEVLRTFTGHTNWIWCVIKLDDQIIASASEDNTIKIWNYETGETICSFNENVPVISLAFHHQNRLLISGCLNGEISMRTLSNDFKELSVKTFKGHDGLIRTIKTIDNERFATGGEDNKIKVWNLEGDLVSVSEHQNFVQCIALLDKNTLISASYDGTIRTWRLTNDR